MGSPIQLQGSLCRGKEPFTAKLVPCLAREYNMGSLQALQIPRKGRKVCMSSSLSWTPFHRELGVIQEGSNQDSLLNGCVKKHLERKLSLPSAFPTKCRSTFLNLSPTVAHTASSNMTHIKAQFMIHQPQGYPFPSTEESIFNCKGLKWHISF